MKQEHRLYLFDRDSLFGDNDELVESNFNVNFLSTLSAQENIDWGIISNQDYSAIQYDQACNAIFKKTNGNNNPIYFYFSGQKIRLDVDAVSGVEIQCDKEKKQQEFFFCSISQAVFDLLLDTDIEKLQQGNLIESEHSPVSFIYNEKIEFQFAFGQTVVAVNAAKFMANKKLIRENDFRLFAIFRALDAAKLSIKLTDELRNIGINSIKTPDQYAFIDAKAIVYVENISKFRENFGYSESKFFKQFGFSCVQSKTESYQSDLLKTLPKEVKAKVEVNVFRSDIQSIFNANPNRAQLSTAEINQQRKNVLKKILDLIDKSDLEVMTKSLDEINYEKLQGLMSYSRCSLFSGCVGSTYASPNFYSLLTQITDKYVQKNCYHQKLSNFLINNLCQRWRSSEVRLKIKAIAQVKPEDQDSISAAHFRMAYMAQYQSEFFKNPLSEMRQQILNNANFDENVDMQTIVDHAKPGTRRKEVLLTLGVTKMALGVN